MRIMFSYGSIYNGGAEKVIVCLANYLVENGEDVFIIVADDGKCGYALHESVRVISLRTMGCSHSALDSCKRAYNSYKSLRRTIKTVKPDVIVAMDPQYAVEAKIAAVGICRKVIGSERSNPFLARTGIKNKAFVMLSTCLDGFIFQTSGAKSYYPILIQRKSVVISNGVFEDISTPFIPFYDREKNLICATGRLSKVKRYDLMIKAIGEVRKDGLNVELHIYGDGNYREEIEKCIRDNNLSEYIVLEGRKKGIYPELMKYRYFLLTSDHEGMPNGLIDAMACGCVCISTDCNFGPSEIIEDGINGFLVPVGSYVGIAERIKELIHNQEIGNSISCQAQNIKSSLSREVIMGKYYKYIKGVVNELSDIG